MPILTEPDVENADENNDNYDEIAWFYCFYLFFDTK
jgi:hypothetical protein